ncbi:3-oxoadipate enol-lactonase 2 [Austwickia sp. TVS 96-490-7B]|uniref:alpha/beta fold hydrolase n=1 Tax=Austwickia sp. TVS 96-490-7B TaxID=2830843 RepID=UPI001C590EB5|nr:alpha/beta hydrolase [Austwickia sp. TVS 96-490-7B]MBW3083854.1 3-oxoadipate enol-lactonase 2 [Austwickia sp. TVS 96-490-7B]
MTGARSRTDASGPIRWQTFGAGEPVTVFAHGLGSSIHQTRPFASGVRGQRVFFHFRAHGGSPAPPGPWSYADLAEELRSVADGTAATRALGVSMGAGALCRLLTEDPTRFERVVLALPAALDRPHPVGEVERYHALARLVEQGDRAAVAALVALQPAGVRARSDVIDWALEQISDWRGSAVPLALRQVPGMVPVPDRRQLAAVTATTLVIAQRGDPAHPVSVAEEIAQVIPGSRLEILDDGGVLWAHRAKLRSLVGEFLGG